MQNKPRGRTDVQWVISSVSLAVTLGLWGLFVGHEKRGAGVAAQVAFTAPPDQVIVTQTQPQLLAPGQVLLFGGTAPQAQQTVTTQTITQTRTHRGGGGGAVTSTGSSRP